MLAWAGQCWPRLATTREELLRMDRVQHGWPQPHDRAQGWVPRAVQGGVELSSRAPHSGPLWWSGLSHSTAYDGS